MEIPESDLTIKATGNQWYWSYEYSDYTSENGESINFDSYIIPEDDLESGQLRLLEVDNRVVLPVQTHIRVLITSADVLHSWAVPSFGVKVDACPGRLNQTSLFIKRAGTFYGQCREICGVNHGFMRIVVEGVELVRRQYTHVSYLLHGNSKKLDPLLTNYPELKKLSTIVHSSQAVLMTQKPTDALRNGKDTSMFSCIDSVQSRQANAAVSCGNTGALMLMSLVKLRKIPGVNRPAIAILWPSRNHSGFNIVLDAGADVKADPRDLLK